MTTTDHKSLTDIAAALDYYKQHLRRHDLPPLEPMSGLQALFPDLELAPEVTSKWPEGWPCGADPGVYFIFGTGVRLLYVGKASMGANIGSRLSTWFKETPGRGCRVVHSGWSEQPRFVAALRVPAGMAFEAPALEEFLIDRLSPPDNRNGRIRPRSA
ncbi:MAG TPA: hypothetical protein VMU04_10210 [Candidatus Acidoferrum sp.]|nr:hypothetical protein [Candidatus Acidoferrum sp.]